jgi:hypothetical protein
VRGFPTREVTGICIDDAILMLTGIWREVSSLWELFWEHEWNLRQMLQTSWLVKHLGPPVSSPFTNFLEIFFFSSKRAYSHGNTRKNQICHGVVETGESKSFSQFDSSPKSAHRGPVIWDFEGTRQVRQEKDTAMIWSAISRTFYRVVACRADIKQLSYFVIYHPLPILFTLFVFNTKIVWYIKQCHWRSRFLSMQTRKFLSPIIVTP